MKNILQKRLYEARTMKLMLDVIKCTIQKFKHYKQVNKKFIEALKVAYPEMHTWIHIDYKKQLCANMQMCDAFIDRPEIRLGMYGEDFTWDNLLIDIERYKIDERIKSYEDKIACFDEDYIKIQQLQTCVANLNIANFSPEIRIISRAIDDIITHGHKP